MDNEGHYDIQDVRRELWHLYHDSKDWEGKSAEGSCDLLYPSYWDCKTEQQFLEPIRIMIYSYAFGPSRSHYVFKNNKEKHSNYYTWEGPDIYAKAIEVIRSWKDEINATV